MKYDFGGYVTRNDLECSDGRVIRAGAFSESCGKTVPLIWKHEHGSPDSVVGKILLEERPDGVYGYGLFNETENGQTAKMLVKHGDVDALSIYANHLRQAGGNVLKGNIVETSLVLAGANPGAFIDEVTMTHADGTVDIIDDELEIYNGLETYLEHEDVNGPDLKPKSKTTPDPKDPDKKDPEPKDPEPKDPEPAEGKTLAEIYNTLTDEQKEAMFFLIDYFTNPDSDANADTAAQQADEPNVGEVFDEMPEDQQELAYSIIGAALANASGDKVSLGADAKAQYDALTDEQKNAIAAAVAAKLQNEGGDALSQSDSMEENNMPHNIFDGSVATETDAVLSHDDMKAIFDDAHQIGSLRTATENFINSHDEFAHGITDIEAFFPEATAVNKEPMLISRRMGWVDDVLSHARKSPFSNIKSTAANITKDEARARGYVKGKQKVEEVITALKRKTTPQTIYKLQKLDRDDIIDITDFDVVAWIKGEMRIMLNEEVARAALVGDGRPASSEDKINEINIRPIWTDDEVYTIHHTIPVQASMSEQDKAVEFIDGVIRASRQYKGSGHPALYVGSDLLMEMRLIKDADGHRLYKTDADLAADLRVDRIVEVEVMDGLKREVSGKQRLLGGIVVNFGDYTFGSNRGGEVNLFDNFDLNFNKQEYLLETRCSGALTQPASALSIEFEVTA